MAPPKPEATEPESYSRSRRELARKSQSSDDNTQFARESSMNRTSNRTSRHRTTPRHLSESTQRRLNSYALAASAAGVGALALTMPAEAKIVYTPAHHVIKQGGSYKLDINHDGTTDFTLKDSYTATTSGFFALLSAAPAAGNGLEGWVGGQAWAFALKAGAGVGPRHYFPGKVLMAAGSLAGSLSYAGSWVNVKNRYVGLKFKIAGKTHYGWARLSVQVTNRSSITATLNGYAYETVAGKSIRAGQTMDSDETGSNEQSGSASLRIPASEPRTLGVLAIGSSGQSVWRRETRLPRGPFALTLDAE
jgi:hypothetical protein